MGSNLPALRVSVWEGKTWGFPWSYFMALRFSGEQEPEVLQLVFGNFLVHAEGRSLQGTLPDFFAFRVESMGDLPPDYATRFDPSAPYISRLLVSSPAPALAPEDPSLIPS